MLNPSTISFTFQMLHRTSFLAGLMLEKLYEFWSNVEKLL